MNNNVLTVAKTNDKFSADYQELLMVRTCFFSLSYALIEWATMYSRSNLVTTNEKKNVKEILNFLQKKFDQINFALRNKQYKNITKEGVARQAEYLEAQSEFVNNVLGISMFAPYDAETRKQFLMELEELVNKTNLNYSNK